MLVSAEPLRLALPMLVAIAASLLQAAATLPAPEFHERPCRAGIMAGARCAIVRVLENRALGRGRTIDLNLVLLPSLGPATLPPIFDIDGGPGLPATKNFQFYATEGAAYRQGRDIVLVDQRGTGGSNPLACPDLAATPPNAPMLPVDQVARCRLRLETAADLTLYGTAEAVADLDSVRRALGYDRIDLVALSYGTTVALRYIAAFPERVRAAVLMGTAPPEAMPPRHHAPAGERALTLLFEDCAADLACRSAFSNPAGDLAQALERIGSGSDPVPAEIFMERLRSLMYQPSGARRVPFIVNRAAQGDFAPYLEATRPGPPSPLADGMFLSVTCAESFGQMDFDEAVRAARSTRFGDYRLQRQRAACDQWPRPFSSAAAPPTRARSNDIPMLLVSGRLDPVTPPEWADSVAADFTRSRHLVIADGGHVLDGLAAIECLDGLILQFLATGDAAGLDATCLATMRAPPFVTGDAPAASH